MPNFADEAPGSAHVQGSESSFRLHCFFLADRAVRVAALGVAVPEQQMGAAHSEAEALPRSAGEGNARTMRRRDARKRARARKAAPAASPNAEHPTDLVASTPVTAAGAQRSTGSRHPSPKRPRFNDDAGHVSSGLIRFLSSGRALSADEASARLTLPSTTTTTDLEKASALDVVIRPPHEVVWADVKTMDAQAYAPESPAVLLVMVLPPLTVVCAPR